MIIERGGRDKAKVLIVDDEKQVLESLSDLLRKEFHVLTTDDPDEALRLLREKPIALLLTDQRMPRLTGAMLLARAAQVAPDTARVLLTAYSDIQAVIQAVNEGHLHCYLTKPWQSDELLNLVRKAVRDYQQLTERGTLLHKLADLNGAAAKPAGGPETTPPQHSSVEAENQTLRESLSQIQAAFEHLRKIQEIIPICMRCGKIKTSDCCWQSVVDYLQEHELYVSHGYCPSCRDTVMREWGLTNESEVANATE